MSLFKQNGSASTQVLIIDGETESQGRNAKEHLPHLSLNAPVFLGEYHSQAGEFGAGLSQVKAIENGNYLQRSFSLESSRVTPRSERISCSSTVTAGGQYTPFPGFQIPNETIIPKEYSARKGNTGISAQEAIPVLPRSVAIICLILNILIPGSGKHPCLHRTVFFRFFLSRCQTELTVVTLIKYLFMKLSLEETTFG